ncbi:thiamine-monophosphate kinase [Verrucomicrobiaceae bacterium N1E253]|uniref:Thiamine-monophosphate kinase n=1 Tax=Oceaniferula marina TaxID=2748318 RepID=A0A851GAK7_9BACT|nr:thiamine-phosphate kinase [Oceaniferula marina]NWK54436.1 thiamine-monophosphate kinase [Oceaniferula marina]
MKRLADIGEDALIASLVEELGASEPSEGLVVGPGDDCAVIDVGDVERWQLLKTDAIVEGVHYAAATSGERVGWKAVARVVSDFAAMGGTPSQLLVTIAMPPNRELAYVQSIYRGLQRCARSFGAGICGGETTSVPDGGCAMISIAGTGWVQKDQLVLRSGGEAGDVVFVTGRLGGSIQGKHLDFTPRVEESAWLVEHFKPRAMMDLSDGLAQDLPRLAYASGLNYRLDHEMIPRTAGCSVDAALQDGEDFELLISMPSNKIAGLDSAWRERFPDLDLTAIGSLIPGKCSPLAGGWEHFRSESSEEPGASPRG